MTPGKAAAKSIDPRARRPAVSLCFYRVCRTGCADGDRSRMAFRRSVPSVEAQQTQNQSLPTERTMTAPILPKTRLLALTLAGLVAATPALAHHVMDGQTPSTFVQGLLSGLGHPVIGFDHLAALIGVGLVASRFARGLALPAFWVVAMAAGVGLHLASADLPHAELLVALSVVIIGIAATLRT